MAARTLDPRHRASAVRAAERARSAAQASARDGVTYRGTTGDERPRHGTVERVLDEDHGAVVVRFERGGRHALPAEALERRAA